MEDFSQKLFNMLSSLPPQIVGVFMALVTSVLRILYDKKETKFISILLETILAGALTLASYHAILALELNEDLVVFVGGTIGFVGPTLIREYILKFLAAQAKR